LDPFSAWLPEVEKKEESDNRQPGDIGLKKDDDPDGSKNNKKN
jgi:hypothetical protein